ncbi:MAG: alpha/beta fold hydrolase [Mycobacterium sp.]
MTARTYVLIPGAGGEAWYWHRVVPLLSAAGHRVIAVDLPAADPAAGLAEYADCVCAAVPDATGPLVLVGQSLGAFTAPLVAARLPTNLLVLVNPMVPAPGESFSQWWEATGQKPAMVEHLAGLGLGRTIFDEVEDFFHDVPAPVRQAAMAAGEPEQSEGPLEQPWPLAGWPDVATAVIQSSDDRLFPVEFQRRVVRDRLGLGLDVVPGGHLVALSHPRELADQLLSYRV